jgi:hypothetical protein
MHPRTSATGNYLESLAGAIPSIANRPGIDRPLYLQGVNLPSIDRRPEYLQLHPVAGAPGIPAAIARVVIARARVSVTRQK